MSSITNLQSIIKENPYSIQNRLDLAKSYSRDGYPDLAAGEAYMALLLIDEVSDDCGEYHAEAVEAAMVDLKDNSLSEERTKEWATAELERDT